MGRFCNFRQRWLPGLLILLASALSGCATQTRSLLAQADVSVARRAELTATPFFPQEDYQCGPAALATILGTAGSPVLPEALVPQVYVPARKGSFAPEMLTAARRNGALAMTIPGQLDSLFAEIRAGNPVVILQNLGLAIYPVWHYAVVIGYDLDQKTVLLRSGTTEREVMAMSTFEHTWARSQYWAMVALPAGRLPATAQESPAVEAMVAFEKAVAPAKAAATWQAALERWPENVTIQMGYGNAAHQMGDHATALNVFQKASQIHPDSVPVLNNLAFMLGLAGRYGEAHAVAEKALALGGPLQALVKVTIVEIQEMASGKRPSR